MIVFFNSNTGKIYGVINNPTPADAELFASNFDNCSYEESFDPILLTKEVVNYRYNALTHSLELITSSDS